MSLLRSMWRGELLGHEEEEEEELSVSPFAFATCVFCIITLLLVVTVLFERMQEYLYHNMSSRFTRPMISSLFEEMTVLGFLSLVTFSISQAGLLKRVSVKIFDHSEEGEHELTELFEEVHYLLFAVMILFIVQVIVLLVMANRTVEKWRWMNKEAQSPDDVTKWMNLYSKEKAKKCKFTFPRSDAYSFLAFRSLRKEFIEMRHPLPPYHFAIPEKQLPITFDYAEYLSICLGHFLAEIVELPPVAWLCLWTMCGIFYVTYLLVKGDLELFAFITMVFTLVELVGLIELQKKCNKIRDLLTNPSDFPRSSFSFKKAAKFVITGKRLVDAARQHVVEENEGDNDLRQPLRSGSGDEHNEWLTVPGWTNKRVKKSPKLMRFLFGDEVVPSKHSSLFWFGQPGFHILLFRVHLLVRSIFIAVFGAVLVPEIWKEKGAGVAISVILLSLTMIIWEYMFVLHDLITTMCHISCCGMMRNIQHQDEVMRHQKTRRTVRAVMMMTTLVSANSDSATCDMSEVEKDNILNSISPAEKNDMCSIFDMYDDDGRFGCIDVVLVLCKMVEIYFYFHTVST